jgi:Lectin C-type domain
MNWEQNRLTCCSLGMEPLLIENARELECLSNLTKNGTWTGNFNYWTSGKNKVTGNWSWCGKDGASVVDANINWEKGQPDNKGGHEDCIHLKLKKDAKGNPDKFVLTDRNCTDKYILACKVNDDLLLTPYQCIYLF